MKYYFFETVCALGLAWLLPAASAPGAEPAPKLTHRPLPGMPHASPAPVAIARAAPRAASPVRTQPAAERARIVFIHRRAKLPNEFTKDLAPIETPSRARTTTAVEPLPVRQGRIRIIPKDEVATLLTPATEPANPSKP